MENLNGEVVPLASKTTAFDQVLPVYAIEDNKLVLKDGRIALGYKVDGVEMEQWTAARYKHLNACIAGALTPLPIGTVVQKTDIFYDKAYKKDSRDKAYFQAKTDGHFMDRLMLFHHSYLFLSFPPEKVLKSSPVNTLFAQLSKRMLENPFSGIGKRLEASEGHGTELMANLEAAGGFRMERLFDKNLESLYLQYFNLQFNGQPRDFMRPIQNQRGNVSVGEKKIQVVTLKGQGAAVHDAVRNGYGVTASMIYPLAHSLQFPHILNQHIMIEDSEQCLNNLDTEKKINNSLHFLSTQENKIKSIEIDQFTADVRTGNKQLVSLNLSVTLFGSNDRLLQQHLEKTMAAFRQVNGCECLVETYDTANIFFANAPGNAAQNFRWLLMPSDYAAPYFNFTTNYQSTLQGELLCDRYRNPLLVNLFNTRLNNQNCLVIGPSGSGKSYTMGNFMCQRFERGARQIIIDVGGSYKNVMESLAGMEAYFEYDMAHPLSFNPFLLEKKQGKYFLTGDKINFLTALLAILWKGNKHPLTPAERAIFVRIIPAYYNFLNSREGKRAFPSMAGFYYWFKAQHAANKGNEEYGSEMQFFNVAQFMVVLKPFVDGEYRQVLNAASEMEISDFPLVCFDMARVKSDPGLYPVISMLVTELALDQVRKYPDDQKFIYMDEAWSMLSDAMGEWVESMFRTIRKNNGSMCIITQGIDEIIGATAGAAIIQNAQTQVILHHTDQAQVKKLAVHLGFSSHEVDKINSIRTGKNYRELFIKQGDTAKTYCVEVCPHLDAVLSSKPVERNYLRKLMRHYQGKIHFAVDQYVEDKMMKKGVFA